MDDVRSTSRFPNANGPEDTPIE